MERFAGRWADFGGIDGVPAGARRIGSVPRNEHAFYLKDGHLYMRDCAGDFFEVVRRRRNKRWSQPWARPSLDEISEDFESYLPKG